MANQNCEKLKEKKEKDNEEKNQDYEDENKENICSSKLDFLDDSVWALPMLLLNEKNHEYDCLKQLMNNHIKIAEILHKCFCEQDETQSGSESEESEDHGSTFDKYGKFFPGGNLTDSNQQQQYEFPSLIAQVERNKQTRRELKKLMFFQTIYIPGMHSRCFPDKH